MRPRPLVDTGLPVTPLGLGLAAVGRPAYINLGHASDLPDDRSVEALRRASHQLLDRAWEHGIRYVDAARSYGYAERFLAEWLADSPERAAAVTVGSKWGYIYTGGWRVDAEVHEVKDHSLETFRRQLGETRALLGDHLALYQIHSADLDTGVIDDEAVLSALVELANDDVAVGLTLSGPRQAATLRRALEVDVDGRNPFSCVQASWNVLEPSVGPALTEADETGWGVILKEALANGRLTGRGEPPGALTEIATAHGTTVDAVALAAALAQPFADVVLSGAATREQLASNVRALGVELTDDDLGRLLADAELPEVYWDRRAQLPWT